MKYLKDGRKVSVVGKLNNEETIVKEVYITECGDELPAGKSFVVKDLFNAPVKSYLDTHKENLEIAITELKIKEDNLRNDIRELGKELEISLKTNKALINEFKIGIPKLSMENFDIINMVLAGKCKYIVKNDYYLSLPIPFTKAIASTYEGNFEYLKCIVLSANANKDIKYSLLKYPSDYNHIEIKLFDTLDKANDFVKNKALRKAEKGALEYCEFITVYKSNITFSTSEKLMLSEALIKKRDNDITLYQKEFERKCSFDGHKRAKEALSILAKLEVKSNE